MCSSPQTIQYLVNAGEWRTVCIFIMNVHYVAGCYSSFISENWEKAKQSNAERKTEHLLIIDHEENTLADPLGT